MSCPSCVVIVIVIGTVVVIVCGCTSWPQDYHRNFMYCKEICIQICPRYMHMNYLVSMAAIFFPTPAAPSCLLNHGTYIFKHSSALVPVLSTQKEPSHCNIYSLIYRHFFNLSNVELTNSYLSKLHMKPSLFALRFL